MKIRPRPAIAFPWADRMYHLLLMKPYMLKQNS